MLPKHHPIHIFRDACCELHNVTCNDCQLRRHKARLGLCSRAPASPQEARSPGWQKEPRCSGFLAFSWRDAVVRKQGMGFYQLHSLADRLFLIRPLLEQLTRHSNTCLILRQNQGQRKSATSEATIARGTRRCVSQEFLASRFSGNKGVLLNDSPENFLGQIYHRDPMSPKWPSRRPLEERHFPFSHLLPKEDKRR